MWQNSGSRCLLYAGRLVYAVDMFEDGSIRRLTACTGAGVGGASAGEMGRPTGYIRLKEHVTLGPGFRGLTIRVSDSEIVHLTPSSSTSNRKLLTQQVSARALVCS